MSKHTAGPWEYFEQHQWRSEEVYGCVRGNGIVIVNGCAPGNIPEESKANARLIAAAPELLDLLYLSLPYVEEAENDPAYKPEMIRKLLRNIRSVIAKAEKS